MADSSALDSFLDKWRTRWPEWSVGETFVAPERRALAVAWFALQQEFEDAMNIAGETLPADAKLAWWGEELHGWAQQRSRHPLGRVLEPVRADWTGLANGLPLLIQAREPAASSADAFAQLLPWGEAMARVESVVLGGQPSPQLFVVQALAQRMIEAHVAAPPQDQSGTETGARQLGWATTLLRAWPAFRLAAPERRLWASYSRARLQRFVQAGGKEVALPSRLRLLIGSWRQVIGG
ncbi:hypothetical protein [Pseudoxanthomonas indica]|uniref:Phytoene/squalene synthetase n=1 Tax=Pseudoxanthomonas indica TaxID=428993 RepID=A0A1T5LVW5_9GAMM|nr:hypothetical protein [Pseudoxanthomonas indica]GGD40353.1 phytoene synthase [Pseudoxanthomonas indica]SKC80013.1 hypothetical protein SAMN06296058_3181 [Pseudoxanthomonas indica]